MNLKSVVIGLSLFLFTAGVSFGQFGDSLSMEKKLIPTKVKRTSIDTIQPVSLYNMFYDTPEKKPSKLKVNTQIGSSFTTDLQGGVALNTYVNPSFSYAVKPRFRVHFGVEANNMYLSNIGYNFYNKLKPFDGNYWYATIYGGGSYVFSKELSVAATVYKTVTMNPKPKLHPNALNFDGYGGTVNVKYNPTENFSIEATVNYNKNEGGFYPMYNGPYNNMGFNNMGPIGAPHIPYW